MYKNAVTDSIFDGVSNIYLLSIASALLAVIMVYYYSNFLNDKNGKPLKDVLTKDRLENTTDGDDCERNKNVLSRCDSFTFGNSDIEHGEDEIHVDGLVSKLKSKRVKELEAQLTSDQLEEEKIIERKQLAAIFELLKKQEAELNMKEINEWELKAQLSLYR